jgi:hypothetical protein
MENKRHPSEILENQSKEIKSVLNNEQIKTEARNTNLELVEKEKQRTALYDLLTPYKEKREILQKEKDTLSLEIEKLYKQVELEKQKNSKEILEEADDETEENLEKEIQIETEEEPIVQAPEENSVMEIEESTAEAQWSVIETTEKSIIKTETGQEIIVLKEPLQIKIEKVIDENVSAEEKSEIQKAFPDENIWDVIKNQVTEQLNDKNITPIEKKGKLSKLKMIGKKISKYLLAVFVTANSFQATTFLRTGGDKEILSYNNTKVENLNDWENVKLHEDEINKLENLSVITKAHENSSNQYIVIDKENGKAHRYQGDNLIKTYNVCLGDSIGDEQTKLKSIYRKVSDEPDVNAEGERVFHRRPEVSLDEATYVENGERYMRPGYEAFTEWGEGNMQTGAGIYTISNKGPFLDDFGIFLKNERGIQVATSLHVNSHLEEYAPDFRFTNGCVGFSKENLMELYRITSSGENIYILPDNPHNKFQIVDGELRFISNQQNVNRTIRPYESKPLILKAENINETGKVILTTIAENKEKLMSLYPTVSNDVYNELAKIAYGIFGQESTFGTYGKARGQYGRIKDFELSAFGVQPSVGPCQVRLENIEQKIKKTFNIKKHDDLFDPRTNAIAAMSILLDNYLYISYNGKCDEYKKLAILKYNAPKEAGMVIKGKKELSQLGPKTSSYIKKVLNYSKLTKIYTTNAGGNYYASNWNYNPPNN